MGNISKIFDPKSWIISNQGESNLLEGDYIYEMIIGEGESDNHVHYYIIEWISKNNYEKILDGTYTLLSFPDAATKLLLFDENKDVIPLVNGNEINWFYINENQLEEIDNMKMGAPKLKKEMQ